jgi:phage N-6-adenine-methyltransferase
MSATSQYAQSLADLKAKPDHLLEDVGDQWCTPIDLFWGINAAFGPFDMDLFTDGDNALCPRFYSVEDNALTQDWNKDLNGGIGFANPPYSRPSKDNNDNDLTGMITIMGKAKAERDKGAKLVFLIRGVPSEAWWPEQADHICFIKGRVGFKLPNWFIPANEKQKATSAGFAGALVIYDKEWRGQQISYIHRDSLRAQGQKLLDIINDAAVKIADEKLSEMLTSHGFNRFESMNQADDITTSQDDSEQVDQIDIEQTIAIEVEGVEVEAEAETVITKWPAEVRYAVEQAFTANPNKFNEIRQKVLSETANKLLLEKIRPSKVIAELCTMLERCEPMRETA